MTGIDRDILITRVLDGEATPEDWAAFRAMAAMDPEVWADLADGQQDRAELSMALTEAIAIADRVDAPVEVVSGERITVRLRASVAWVGWAAAAMLAVGAIIDRGQTPAGGPSNQAGLLSVSTPEEALDLYKSKGQEEGTFISEVPERLLVESRALEDGSGYEVIYVRQFIERAQVHDMYRFGQDEAGNVIPLPYKQPTGEKNRFTY
jgi:hypothetical protein